MKKQIKYHKKIKRPIHYFSEESLKNGQKLTPMEIIRYLEDFKTLHLGKEVSKKSESISIKIPELLFTVFKRKAELEGIPYQTKIKKLMKEWTLH